MSVPEKELPQQSNYYILAPADTPPESGLALKHGEVFGLWDRFGDIDTQVRKQDGVFFKGTRFLSLNRLHFQGARPLLLSSTVRRDNVVLAVDLTNPDLYWRAGPPPAVPRGNLHLYRAQFLWGGVLYQRVHLKNFSRVPIEINLRIEFGADFVDIFEVRGHPREHAGRVLPPRQSGQSVILQYEGLDGVPRQTTIKSLSDPEALTVAGLNISGRLDPGADRFVESSFSFEIGKVRHRVTDYHSQLTRASAEARKTDYLHCVIETSNEQFDRWMDRSRADMNMLLTNVDGALYPDAGLPWFATQFGRDGIIAASECLWMAPDLARGVLQFLAKTQATVRSAAHDSEPGKILHEAREGEMAALGEIPFGRYYGSVDSTPLYLMLAGAYFKRTGDLEFLRSIWTNIEAALAWIGGDGDLDRDGFVEYSRRSKDGLVQQGWKDSQDSVFHADGSLAEAPIALCEVQGYVYAAKMGLADIAEALGDDSRRDELKAQAKRLRDEFDKAFWSAKLGMYALALDGTKNQCAVRSSNAGHLLYCGIVPADRAAKLGETFLNPDFHSGWGVRTIAEGEARYNPMAYHNGSVWPHDNAIIAAGLSRYGLTELSARILTGIFQAASMMDLDRLPELFCGFRRRVGKGPTWYPTACSPQAWAAGSAFLLLQSSLGLSVDAVAKQIVLRRPVLPPFLDHVRIQDLKVDSAHADLHLFRSGDGVAVTVERRVGEVEIVVLQ
jgi:glycogen debranching enzyme